MQAGFNVYYRFRNLVIFEAQDKVLQQMSNKTVQTTQGKNKKTPSWFALNDIRASLILVITCIALYGNTVFNDYSWDDPYVINNVTRQGIAAIPNILTQPYSQAFNKSFEYRPVSGILYAVEYQIFGENPHEAHLVNILLYACCVLVVFFVFKEVFQLNKIHPWLPFIIALFFAVHPSHTEVVASIKNREEILSILLGLLCLLYTYRFFTTTTHRIRTAFIACLALQLSVASKQSSLPLTVIILGVQVYYGFYKRRKEFVLFNIALYIAYAIFSNWMNLVVLTDQKREMWFWENPLVSNHDFMVTLGTTCKTMWFYFKFMFWPYPFSFYYGYNMLPMVNMSDPVAFFSFSLHGILFLLGAYLLFKRRYAGIFIISYFLCMYPYSNISKIATGIVAERALFLPGVWFIAAFMVGVFKISGLDNPSKPIHGTGKFFMGLGIGVFTLYAWLVIERNFDWKDEVTLMSADIGHLENSTLANYYTGWVLSDETKKCTTPECTKFYNSKAVKYLKQAIYLSPEYPEPYYKLGMIYQYDLNQPDSAFRCFRTAYNLNPNKTWVQFQLARCYYLYDKLDIADTLLTDLYSKLPTDTLTLFFWAQTKYLRGDTAYAATINEQLLQFASDTWYPYVNAAYFAKLRGNMPDAVKYYDIALQHGCRDREVIGIVVDYYNSTNQTEKANNIRQQYIGTK
jgi:tetratricopeptide (TPR) repeat protein